jgi:hypothetical protein
MKLSQKLDLAAATAIKAAVWEGLSQNTIAEQMQISQPTVSRITQGQMWADAKWPDGSTGALNTAKWRAHRAPEPTMKEAIQAEQLEPVEPTPIPQDLDKQMEELLTEMEREKEQELFNKLTGD